ncbi:hypothetical protein [Kitasatospora sp. NPDC057223]|uniref:hypothetical protein n=1 Tax=Kitasatospora sp. NPDC057223 TaxID=3346055 RepID=UPI0036414A07
MGALEFAVDVVTSGSVLLGAGVREQGAFPPAECAVKAASSVAGLHREGITEELAGRIPRPEDLVRTCLDLIPLTFEQAAAPYRLGDLDRPAIRRSRKARSPTTAAESLLGLLENGPQAAELRRWTAPRPHLV